MAEEIGFEVHLDQPYEQALQQVIEALKEQGFGVLTRIDVQSTLKEKLDVDFHPYAILGACNPPLAHRALSQDSIAGLLLPCNVTVEDDAQGGVIVRLANPEAMLSVGGLESDPVLRDVAQEARFRLEQVAERLLAR